MRKVHPASALISILTGTFVLTIVFATQSAPVLRAAQAPTPTAAAGTSSVEQGRKSVSRGCVQCHGPQHYAIQRKSAEGWRRTVYDMVTRGSPLLVEEIEPVVAFLTATFGPNSPIPGSKAGPLPDERGREILMANCTMCHAVEMVRGTKKSEAEWLQTIDRMVTNGATIAATDKPILAKYAAANFGAQ
jgi:cytochrome c5